MPGGAARGAQTRTRGGAPSATSTTFALGTNPGYSLSADTFGLRAIYTFAPDPIRPLIFRSRARVLRHGAASPLEDVFHPGRLLLCLPCASVTRDGRRGRSPLQESERATARQSGAMPRRKGTVRKAFCRFLVISRCHRYKPRNRGSRTPLEVGCGTKILPDLRCEEWAGIPHTLPACRGM